MRINIELAGIPIELVSKYRDYLPLYSAWRTDAPPLAAARADAHELELARKLYTPDSTEPYLEHMVLCAAVSDALIPHGRVLFHGVAFRLDGKAWIVTAPSGVGKTTLYLNLKLLYGKEVEIINGDKPILCFGGAECGTSCPVIVYPSPWNGKECMGQGISAPLGGIILLTRGAGVMRRVAGSDAAEEIFRRFVFTPESAERVAAVAALETRLIGSGTAIWRLESGGDSATAKLCRETIEKYGKDASAE